MINITLSALIRILLNNNISFTVEKTDDAFQDPKRTIIRFVISKEYPGQKQHIVNPDDYFDCQYDRARCNGFVGIHYCLEECAIIACCLDWHNMIKNQIRNIKC